MNLLEVFTWQEEDVFANFSKFISEEPTITDNKNFAFWDRKSPILLQAHIDVVSFQKSKAGRWDYDLKRWVDEEEEKDDSKDASSKYRIKILQNHNIITAEHGILGGDDRAGVMAIVSINNTCVDKKLPMPSILLTNGEETGGIGMNVFVGGVKASTLDPVRLVVAMDRRGLGEYVCYIAPPKEVLGYIESFGFSKTSGSWSDSRTITSKFRIPHVNLSIGYYDPHSTRETVHVDEVFFTARRVLKIIQDPIKERYETKEYVYKQPAGYLENFKNNQQNTNKTQKNTESNRDKCEKLQKKLNLPLLSARYPYLDYLLSKKDCEAMFHIVSSPMIKDNAIAKHGAKPLSRWIDVFNKANYATDEIAKAWQDEFGKEERMFVCVGKDYPTLFYMAIKINSTEPYQYRTAYTCETKEDNIMLSRKYFQRKREKESEATVESAEDNFVKMHGYCSDFADGTCDGSCHGNRVDCPYHSKNIGFGIT